MSNTSRPNIFDLMKEKYNLSKEIVKIDSLLEEYMIDIKDISLKTRHQYTLEEFMDDVALQEWKNRLTYISCDEIREDLGLEDVIFYCSKGYGIEDNKIINYIEYVVNIINVCERYKGRERNGRRIVFNNTFDKLDRNINIILDYMNHETKYFAKEEKTIVVEKNPTATSVAEIVEQELAFKVLEYNHHLLKGNISRKREILKALADKIEPFRDNLDKDLDKDFGNAANELNIRHNNLEGVKRIAYVADMSDEELEMWYDETYQIMLLCILQNEYKKSIKPKFKQFRRNKESYKEGLKES